MPKRRSPAPRAPKVPARFRAIGGVDPRRLPPGSPYPCGDALVGQRARGKRIAGVVQSCAVPPAGARGPHYALGNVVSGSEIGRAWRASAREAEALDARYSGPDFDLRRKRPSKARPAAPSPAPVAPRPAVRRREELPLPLPQGGLRRREVSPEGLEIVRGFDDLSRRWGTLPSSTNTPKWLAGLMVIDGDLHVYGDALVAMGVASALGNLYPSSTIRGVFVSAFNDAVRAANLAQMGQDDRTPVVVDVKPIPAVYDAATRGQPVTRSVRLSFTSHGQNGEHFDVRAAQGARLTRASELAAPLPKGGLRRPELPLPTSEAGRNAPTSLRTILAGGRERWPEGHLVALAGEQVRQRSRGWFGLSTDAVRGVVEPAKSKSKRLMVRVGKKAYKLDSTWVVEGDTTLAEIAAAREKKEDESYRALRAKLDESEAADLARRSAVAASRGLLLVTSKANLTVGMNVYSVEVNPDDDSFYFDSYTVTDQPDPCPPKTTKEGDFVAVKNYDMRITHENKWQGESPRTFNYITQRWYYKPVGRRISLLEGGTRTVHEGRRDDARGRSAVSMRNELPLPLPKGGLRRPELPLPLPEGGLPRPKAKRRVPEMAGPSFDPREMLRVDAEAPVRRLVRVEITAADLANIAPRDIEVGGQRVGVGWQVKWGQRNDPDIATVGPAWFVGDSSGSDEPGLAISDASVKAIERLNKGSTVRVVDVTDEYAIIATTAPPRYDSGGAVRIPAPGYEPSKFRGLVGGPKWRVVAIPKGWLQWQIDRNRSGSHPTAVVTLGEVNASMVKRREELPLPLPEGGLSRPAPRPALRAPGGYSPEAVRAAIDSFFATGPIAPDALRVLDAAVDALYARSETSYMPRDPGSVVPAEVEHARDAALVKRRGVRAGAATRTLRAARGPSAAVETKSAKSLLALIEDVSHRLRLLATVLPVGMFPGDKASSRAAVPVPSGTQPVTLPGWQATGDAPRDNEMFTSASVFTGNDDWMIWPSEYHERGIAGFNERARKEFDDYEWRKTNPSSSPHRQIAWVIFARDPVVKRERIVGFFGKIPAAKKEKLSPYFGSGLIEHRVPELPLPLPKGGLRRPELPLPLPKGGLPRPRPVPRRSTVARREELPLPVPPSFLKDPPPTEASMPVGEAMEAVAEASADGTNWSKYQSAIFKFITLGTGNAVVEAVAGSGKSTTIVEAVKRIPSNKSVLVLAFNRTVRDELKEKFTGFTNVTVRTLSGHGWVTMAQAWKPIVQAQGERDMWYQGEARFRQILDAAGVPPPVLYWDRLHREAARRDAEPAHVRLVQWLKKNNYDEGKYEREVMTWNRHYESLKKLIELCRGFMALTPAAIQDVQREYGLLLTMPRRRGDGASAAPRPWTWFDPHTNTTYDTDTVIRWVQAALKASLIRPVDGKVAKFDATFPTAMLDYFAPQQFDWIFVDETQDMDTSQLIVVQKSVAPGGRVVVVGDSKQAIYAFRGADSRAMARMEQALNAVRLPLSVSYRVPKCVETMVRPVVPAFEVPPGTPEGVCKTVTARHMIREWRDGDFVISRKNAPLEPLAIMAIQQGKSVVAVGLADIQKVLRDVVNGAMKFNPTNGDEFRDAIEKYRARQRANIEEIERRKRARSFSRMKDHEVEAFIEDLPVVRTLDLAANAVESMSKRVNGSAEIDQIIASVNYSASRDQIVPASALKGKLAFTSVHKIKGAESPRVWVLNDTFAFQGKVDATGKPNIKNGEEMTDNARQEEINLWYVAVTRAKNTRGGPPGELYLVTGLKDVLGEAYVDDDEDEGKAKDA